MPLLSKRKLQRYYFLLIAMGFILLWLVALLLLWSNWHSDQQHIRDTLSHDAEIDLKSKALEIEGTLQQIYHSARTISLLPGVRSIEPINRNSNSENVVDLGLISQESYDTVQQLYNHIASSVALSEIYIVYDGFAPQLGQVPFVMFDQVIVDKFAALSQSLHGHETSDSPVEDETEEYQDYVRQLDYLRKNSFSMPLGSLENIISINSGLIRTCDNTQFLSKEHGHVRHTYGLTLSVPIYGLEDRQFKGLVTAVLRANVLEAALLDWPVLPVTASDRQSLYGQGIDFNSTPLNYLLEEQSNGVQITDSRHVNFSAMQDNAAYHFQMPLALPGHGTWLLHNYVPKDSIDSAMKVSLNNFMFQLSALSLVLYLLWLSVNAVLKTQRNTALQLQELADIDPLTGLPNRRMIGMYLNTILNSTKTGQFFAVIMIDLDDFKQVNDSMGHESGDRMLIEVGQRFNSVLRSEDPIIRMSNNAQNSPNLVSEAEKTLKKTNSVVGRLGGDEFLVILSDLSSVDVANLVVARLRSSLLDPIEIGVEKIYARASMGIATYPNDGENAALLMRHADIALFEAKRRGHGQTVAFSPELNEDAMRRLKMMTRLNEALQADEFFLLYQPELHISTGEINAAEALLRWYSPEFGLVMPFEFIPLLERSGLINEVGNWILRTACLQLKSWQENDLPVHSIGVNISTKQLAQLDFVDTVANIIQETKIKPENLVLEVTESSFMHEPELAIQTLTQLRSLGVSVAIDDFGTGFSSLSYLQKIPLDILKIDRSFVIETNTKSGLAICDTLIVLAERLGLKVVAEGIETKTQLECLKAADWIQGYYIARPLSPDEFAQKIREFSL